MKKFILIGLLSSIGFLHTADLNLSSSADSANLEDAQRLYTAMDHPNNLEKVKALLDSGVDVNVQHPDYAPVLITAIRNNENIKFIQFLLDNGANTNATSKDGWTPLQLAAGSYRAGSAEKVYALLEAGANPDDSWKGTSFEPSGLTPLMLAADTPGPISLDSVKALLKHNANPNLRSKEGKTALDHTKKPAIWHVLHPVTEGYWGRELRRPKYMIPATVAAATGLGASYYLGKQK